MNTQQLLNIFNRSARRSTADKKQVITARVPERLASQINELTVSSKLKRSDVVRLLLEYALSNYADAVQNEDAAEFAEMVQQMVELYKQGKETPEAFAEKLQALQSALITRYQDKVNSKA